MSGMKNFIFLSPNFPDSYWRFCAALREQGVRVLGIGDCPYDNLSDALRASLEEYYKVGDLGNYEEVYSAVAFFLFKYGRCDALESNNEFWLERDARLRTDFNIPSGFHVQDMKPVKYKSQMKEKYRLAGIPVARYVLAEDFSVCREFLRKVGCACLKPDNGVGANGNFKISNEEELRVFFEKGLTGYIMEEFVNGTVCSYDAIVDCLGNPVFETGNITPHSLMDIVNEGATSCFYIVKELADDVRDAGRRALKAFRVKSRFVHFEFFRLDEDCALGKKGSIVALEVNMRPSGGCSPDMMNYANSVDVYRIWGEMMAKGTAGYERGEHCYCMFVGRRTVRNYKLSHEQILQRYGEHLKSYGGVDSALAPAMGNYHYIAVFDTEEEGKAFITALSE